MITVRVLDRKTGKSVKSATVALYFSGFLTSGFTRGEYTDEYGEAHFDHEPGSGEVYVSGRKVREGLLRGLIIIYI